MGQARALRAKPGNLMTKKGRLLVPTAIQTPYLWSEAVTPEAALACQDTLDQMEGHAVHAGLVSSRSTSDQIFVLIVPPESSRRRLERLQIHHARIV